MNAALPVARRFRLAPLVAAAAMALVGAQASAAVVFSEDFSGGNPVASTAYTLVPAGTSTVPPDYRVVSDPGTDFANSYNHYFDHTSNTAAGAMMFFDGVSQATIYGFSANLVAGSSYTFSFWGSSGSDTNNPTLAASIGGMAVGMSLPTVAAQWTQFSYAFVATATGIQNFAIFDTNGDSFGNDGAIDDVRLVGPDVVIPPGNGVPEPGVVGLLGLGVLAACLGRRRGR